MKIKYKPTAYLKGLDSDINRFLNKPWMKDVCRDRYTFTFILGPYRICDTTAYKFPLEFWEELRRTNMLRPNECSTLVLQTLGPNIDKKGGRKLYVQIEARLSDLQKLRKPSITSLSFRVWIEYRSPDTVQACKKLPDNLAIKLDAIFRYILVPKIISGKIMPVWENRTFVSIVLSRKFNWI